MTRQQLVAPFERESMVERGALKREKMKNSTKIEEKIIPEETYDNAWKLYNPYCKKCLKNLEQNLEKKNQTILKPLKRESQFLFCKYGHLYKTKIRLRNGYLIRLWKYWRIIFLLLLLICAFCVVLQAVI